MKAIVIAVAFAAGAALAQAGEMKSMEMKDMSPSRMAKDAHTGTHVAKGTVKSVDAKGGTIALNHEPVKSMNWPAMTMTFQVRDKTLMEKLGPGKRVEVEFEQRGKDYVITSTK